MEKKLYAIYHGVDEDGGYGDAVYTANMMGIVRATEEEIEAYIAKWNKPIVYDHPYDDLSCHNVYAEEVVVANLDELNSYGEGDYYGLQAKEYEFRKAFNAQYGDRWNYSDKRDELYELYFKGMEEIRKKHEEGI